MSVELDGGRRGSQVPRISLIPPPASTDDAGDAIELAGAYGLTPDPWQERVIKGWMGRRSDGKWSSPRCGLAVPRQNGKNGALEVRELFGMIELGEKFLHTAHEVKTARKAFLRLLSFFENERQFPELAALVVEIRKTNGQEAIILANGGSVEIVARSKGSARGFTVDVLVCDEAQELGDEDYAALLPTISAAPLKNPQRILTGTPPAPSMDGVVFTRIRQLAMKGIDDGEGRLCWQEWSCESLDDLDVWQANPALGDRLSLETVEDEREEMDPVKFGRERGGIWDDHANANAPIPPHVWAARENAELTSAAMASVAAFGIEVSLEGAAWIGAASQPHAARIAVDLVPRGTSDTEMHQRRRGTAWVVGRCVELKKYGVPFVVDGRGLAAPLIPALEAAGLTVITAATPDIAAAYAMLCEAAAEDELVHGPQPDLERMVAEAKSRPMGDGPATFGRKASGGDIAGLLAVMLAHWAAKLAPKPSPQVWSLLDFKDEIEAERAGKEPELAGIAAKSGPILRPDGSTFTPF